MSTQPNSAPPSDVPALLTVSRRLSPVHALLTLSAPAIASRARPGQFVHVRVLPGGSSPLLRRPFSVAGVNRASGSLRILVRAIGRGTELLANLPPGVALPALGPLGQPFPEVPPDRDVLLVAGGVGIAPLLFFAWQRRPGSPRAIYGAETAEALVLEEELEERCSHVGIATDDGTAGHHGFVTDLLPEELDALSNPVVLACGPRPMMAVTAAECLSRGVECYVSFEAWLGCGIGACLGCVIPAAGQEPPYLRVCRDGPVFAAEQVDWQALD